mmetsp:Transcript_55/g.137  ORF Transcript_55/g.137 Transcript_55/m.137 type:complete len:222 (+) Transcript_55:1240-1905(+)
MRLDICLQIFLRHRSHALFRAENRAPKRRVLERRRVQVIKEHLFDILFNLLHFAQNHPTLALNLRLFQRRILQDITQDIHRLGDVLLEHLGVIRRLFAARVRVQMSTHVFNFLLQARRRARLRALKRHVLQEMSRTIRRRIFISRSSINPHAHGGGFRVRSRLSRHAQPIRERRHLGLIRGGDDANVRERLRFRRPEPRECVHRSRAVILFARPYRGDLRR